MKILSFVFLFQIILNTSIFANNADTLPGNVLNRTVYTIDKPITGKVTNANDEPILGVTISVVGTNLVTKTDDDGNYTITVEEGSRLRFSFIGYVSQTVVVTAGDVLNVKLDSETANLDEVVVVGYGTQKKGNITGAIQSINSKEIKSISTSNIATGLAGKLPGLRVTQQTSEPGSFNTKFDIRGFGNPLIVVDGIIMDNGNFSRLNPNDIEEMSILKDASAAVYGVKAANGVILVTTKKGVSGKPKISYSGYYQFQKPTNTPEIGDAYSYATITTENEVNNGTAPGSTTFSPDDLQKYKDGTYPSTDWYGLVARDHTDQKNHHLSVTGGTENIKYFTSLGFTDEVGLWKSGDLNYKKYNLRTSVTGNITNDLEIEVNVDALMDKKNELAWDSWYIFTSLYWQDPTKSPFTNNNPDYFIDVPGGLHSVPLTNADYGYLKTTNKNFQGNLKLNYKIPFIEGLSAKFVYGYYNQDLFQKKWAKNFLMHSYDPETDQYNVVNSYNDPSNLTGDYTTFNRETLSGQLQYSRIVASKHSINAALIYEARHEGNDNMWARKEFSIDVDQFFAGLSNNSQVNSTNIYENANRSVIGKFNYDYASKYLIELGFNYGGSSKFPKGQRWGFFPYASLGWRISEESFFKDHLDLISNLKLRGSWGQMGDDDASTFQFLTGYDYPSGNYVFNNEVVAGLGFRGMPNPNITWFTITSKNVGIDMDMKNGLFNFQFDLFQRDRSGLLGTRLLTIPGTVGANLPQENLNKDSRKGFELVIGHSKKIGDLSYSISGNLTYTRAKATYVERAADANSYLNWRNNTTNRWDNLTWGYKLIGQFQSQEEIFESPLQDDLGNKTLRPGDLKYEDINKDGMISDLDVVPIGRGPMSDINFGINASLSFKQIDMNLLFQGASNFNYSYARQLTQPVIWAGRNPLKMFMDRWHHEDIYDINSPWIAGHYPSTGYPPSVTWPSEFWIPDASYLRLKSLEIGYTFKETILSKTGIQNLRLYVSGFNLITWTKLKNVDPEAISNDGIYPINQSFNLGINVSL